MTFATGTPISNSMTELYTNMHYLQYGTLQKLGLGHFDSWAAAFGETQTAIELAPEGDGTFNVYEDIRNELVEKRVLPEEIAFIHEANTELRKAELFGKVRSGQVRFLLGSTQKMGAGTALVEMCKEMKTVNVPATVGEYAGFKMAVSFDSFNHKFVMNLKGQLSEAQTKLETVERQLETAKVEVIKPFAQEAELAEKLEQLSALNALLNMDEKGDDAIGMDDTPEEGNGGQGEDTSQKPAAVENAAKIPCPIENAGWVPMTGGGRPPGMKAAAAMCDKPAQKMSLKEKLEAFKAQAAGTDRADAEKAKRKEETL